MRSTENDKQSDDLGLLNILDTENPRAFPFRQLCEEDSKGLQELFLNLFKHFFEGFLIFSMELCLKGFCPFGLRLRGDQEIARFKQFASREDDPINLLNAVKHLSHLVQY